MEEKERAEILLEHMDQKIDLVLESHLSLDRKIEKGLEEARVDRESIKQQMALFVQTLSGKIDQNREKIEEANQKVEINRQEIVKNRSKIEEVDDKLSSSLKKYENHEDRIKVLKVTN